MKKVTCADLMFLLTIIAGTAGSYVIWAISYVIAAMGGSMSEGAALFLSELCLALPVIVLLIIHKVKNPKESIMEYMRIRKIKIGTIFLVILFSFLIRPLLTFVNVISLIFVENEVQNTLSPMIGSQNILLSLLLIGVLPGVAEEFVYRGYFFGTYKLQGFWKGVIISSLIFGLMHMNFNQFGYALVMGVIMCLLAEASGSIIGGMLVHFCINGGSVITMWGLPKLIDFLGKYLTPSQMEEYGFSEDALASASMTSKEALNYLAVLAVPTVVFTALAALVLYAIACVEKRKRELLSVIGKENLADRKNNASGRPLAPYERAAYEGTAAPYEEAPITERAPAPSGNTDSQFVEENMIKNDAPSPQPKTRQKGKNPGPLFYIAALYCIFRMISSAVG